MIPVNRPRLDGNERKYLLECLESGWISSEGPFVQRFESAYAQRVGRRHAISVSSGTAALEVAMTALQLKPGDEVIVPSFTIISCVSAVLRAGGKPVLVDCDPATWNMDVDQVRKQLTPRTRAILPVHVYGLPVDLDPLLEIAAARGIKVIEDAAEAIGLRYKQRECGAFGDASCLSFYANKLVTTGEGGMVLTDDDRIAEHCARYRNLAFQPGRRFEHDELGWNYRMCNLQAAVGLAQLERLDETIAAKRRMAQRYRELLEGVTGITLPVDRTAFAQNVYWVFGVVLDDDVGFDAAEAARRLAAAGVQTRPFFWPMHEQPVFRRMGLFEAQRHPVSERLARRGLYLPSGVDTSDDEIRSATQALRDVLR